MNQTTRTEKNQYLLEVTDLNVSLPTGPKQSIQAVKSVSLQVKAGERIGIVGESGSGKSVTVRAISGLLPESKLVKVGGSIRFKNDELTQISAKKWREIQSKNIGMIFQDPMSFLNPTMTIGKQIDESLQRGRSADKSPQAILHYMELAGLKDGEELLKKYPFQLSGGMRQRVLIALALAKSPELIIADEPTTALDATIQRKVLKSLDESVSTLGTSLLLITHDLAVVAGMCDRVYVMFRGNVVEEGTVDEIYYNPQHEYTKDLLRSVKSFSDDSEELYVSQYGRL